MRTPVGWTRRNRSRRHGTHRRAQDAAHTHVLEAVIVVSIMVSAVAFVVTVEDPAPPTHSPRETLEVKARDVLDILYDTPVTEGNYGSNELSAFIAKCLNKKCAELESKLQKLVPTGASYALYVSNGQDTYPVLVKGEPRGEAVTASRTFQPDWSSTFLATATESIGTKDALLTYALPIFHSTPVAPGGSQIFVKVTGTRVSDGSDYVLIASAATTAQDANDPTAVAASLYFVDDAGNPLPVHALDPVELIPYRMTLRLAETQNVEIPAGTEVTIQTPRGWTAAAPQADNPYWTILSAADDKNGSYVGSAIRATLNAPLRDGYRDLFFDITYHGDVLDYYPLTASLRNGANAVASTIIRGESHETVPPLATPLLHLSVPSPMGRGAQTTWTLSAYIPVNDDEDAMPDQLRSEILVHKVELIEQEGNPIFATGVGAVIAGEAELMGGTWASTGDSLVWTSDPGVLLDATTPLNLTFRVSASGTPGPSDVRSQFVPPVTYDTWTGRLVGRTGWGFYRQAILPEDETYAGYNRTAGVLGAEHPLQSDGVYRQTSLPGQIQYNVSLAGAVQDSLYGSYVIAEERSVPPDGEVVINANVQSVLFALAEAGQRAGVTVRFYPPWSGDERQPEWEQPMLDQNLLTGEVSQLVVLDLNGDGLPDPVVGSTNGRVIAYDARTGQRLQGNAFTVPLNSLARSQQAVPKVTALETIRLFGEDYLVVATDKYSDGLFILDREFKVKWRYTFITNVDALTIDTSTSFDDDGEPEILVARSEELAGVKYSVLYALKADPATATLTALPAKDAPVTDPDRLAMVLGTPSDILAREKIGPRGDFQGVLTPIQTTADPGLQVQWTPGEVPSVSRGASSTPRAGVVGINELGETTGTLFGAPASVIKAYDYDKQGPGDALIGGASGYVIMANGSVLTQPLYSYVIGGWSKIISADTRSSSESYLLTQDGQVVMTDDGWVSLYGPIEPAVGAKAISSNEFNSYWVVGTANGVWKSVEPSVPQIDDPAMLRHPAPRELAPVTLVIEGSTYDLQMRIHEFRDVYFRGTTGYIVGAACALPALCGEPIMLKTTNGGATWRRLSDADGTLENRYGGPLDKNLTRIRVFDHGGVWTGWVVGDGGLVARSDASGSTWKELDLGFAYDVSYDFNDIGCLPQTPDTCWVVGDSGAAFVTYDARAPTPTWENKTGTAGLPVDRDLFSVGFPDDGRGFVGSQNMVLGSYGGSTWSALPLNYFENDGRVVSTAGDGGGFVFGGTDANGRIWFLHDYSTQSQVQSVSLASELPEDAHVTAVSLIDGNVTFAQQTILVNVTEGTSWKTIGPLVPEEDGDSRKPVGPAATWGVDNWQQRGNDVKFRIVFNTSTDKTVLTPSVRALTLRVDYRTDGGVDGYRDISLDLTSTAQVDEKMWTADWNLTTREVRQPLVREFWTRNVSGEVYDIQTGFDLESDGYEEVWVATGDTLSENSPDYIIYAGTDLDRVVERHNRVYLLNGANGQPRAISDWLEGEVRHIRLVDEDGVGGPDILFAATWNVSGEPTASGKLYALDPVTLAKVWEHDLGREVPADMETIELPGDNPTAIVGASRPADETSRVPHLWSIPQEPPRERWKVIPDDLGRYLIRKAVEPNWFYGPHVVEVAVEWEETVTETQVNFNLESVNGEAPPPPPEPPEWCEDPPEPECPETPEGSTVLRAARFYDHFMVAPPQAISAPNPIYTARLLMWLDDWG